MGVGAGLYMYVIVVQKFTFVISSPEEFLSYSVPHCLLDSYHWHTWCFVLFAVYLFLTNVNSCSRSLFAVARPSVVCLSSVTLVRPIVNQ